MTIQQSKQEAEAGLQLWESNYAPANFIRDESPQGLRNAQTLAQLIQANFGGVFSPSNLTDALTRFRDQFFWKQPAQPQPAQPSEAELAVQAEAERSAKQREQDEARKRLISKQNDPRRHTEVYNPVKEASDAASEIRDAFQKMQQEQARQQADGVQAYRWDGKPDRAVTAEIQKIVVRRNNDIDWKETHRLRVDAAKQFEHQSRIKRDLR